MTRRLVRLATPLLAVVGMLTSGGDVAAGWDNVFQVCCHDCRSKPIRSFFRAQGCDDCAQPQPQPQRRVEFQRSFYYEPVTVMKPERFTEAVPVQVHSFFWEPVTTYTRASFFDPCTCTCQDICIPRTSMVRRERCDTVTRYVERCRMVPVQVQRKVEVCRPVVTWIGPETRRYLPADCELPPAGVAGPVGPVGPRVDEFRTNPPSVTPEGSTTIPPQQLPITEGSRRRILPPTRPSTGTVNAHTTSRPGPASLRGEIVLSDQVTPRPGAKLVFVSAANHDRREYVTADQFGNFDLRLPAGDWHVYLGSGNGRAVYHKKITVGAYDAREFMVVSR